MVVSCKKGPHSLPIPVVQRLCYCPGDAQAVICTRPAANLIQDKVGAINAWSFDIGAACSGFIYALALGTQIIEAGRYNKIVVVGTDKMSSITNYNDRNTCVLFGDAAGAVLLEPTDKEDIGILDFLLHSDGSGAEYLNLKAGGSKYPATVETVANDWHYIYQDGKTVFKLAVQRMADIAEQVLVRNSYSGKDVNLLVPHQANLRIIKSTAARLKLREDQIAVNIERYANTTAATIPISPAGRKRHRNSGIACKADAPSGRRYPTSCGSCATSRASWVGSLRTTRVHETSLRGADLSSFCRP